MKTDKGNKIIQNWLQYRGWKMAAFQKETMKAVLSGKNGLLNAPTGSGKTYAMFFPILAQYINESKNYQEKQASNLRVLWITPLRALAKDLQRNLQLACDEMQVPWSVGIRTGDIGPKEKAAQKKAMPQVLLITPESLHLLLAQKKHEDFFKHLRFVVADEWHELLASKRGVQTELALSRLRHINLSLQTWAISATISNLEQALEVITGINSPKNNTTIIRSGSEKKVTVESVLPDNIQKLPWAGYLGVNLLDKVMPIVMQSSTTLLFTNTRSQTEIWYRFIMEKYPDMSGLVALHHGSLDRELRNWVEDTLHEGKLKLVICTSSLDLGVDFRPVETVIQVGSPKSVARFLQRAGRSGHQPGATSKIYFVPTHAMELIEGVSLREGVKNNMIEERSPVVQSFDVLAQYMVTIAVGDGFEEQKLFEEVKTCFAYQFITREEWLWLLEFITTGGPALYAYDEFKKVEKEDGRYVVKSKKIAMRHRLGIGTIVSDALLQVKYMSGKYLGTIEENFISHLKPGDVFTFAGMSLELVKVREMTAHVRRAASKKGAIPRWAGGRIPLSSTLSAYIRERLDEVADGTLDSPELKKMEPLLNLQNERSTIPHRNQLLIEQCQTREGFHTFVFPFEGRLVHEGMASLLAWRISKIFPISFSIAMNDYGFELLSDKQTDFKELLKEHQLFTTDNLLLDIQQSVNAVEMARRKFREIATIAGMVFQGYPGKPVKAKHLQASTSLMFDVLREHEPGNLLIRQSYQEALDQQLEEKRLYAALQRIKTQKIIIQNTEKLTPFAFPIMVDRLREQLTSEKLEDRIEKMIRQIEK